MASFDRVVSGGLVANSQGIERIDIGIKDGKVTARQANLPTAGAEVIDARGKYVLPGAFDVHLHPMYGDNMASGSKVAAYGGITSLVPYVYAYKGLTLKQALDEWIAGDASQSILDFGAHLGVLDPPATVDFIPEAIERGVMSFKFFMAYRRRGMMAEDDLYLKALELIAKHKGLMMTHAENGLAIDYLEQKFISEGKTSIEYFEKSRPKQLEYEAVFRAITLASLAECPLYLVHQTTGEAVEIIGKARARGQFVVGETCPQYLLWTNDDLIKRGPIAILTPPYRSKWDNDELWKGLSSGIMSTVGSDHSPHPREKKVVDNVFQSPVGTPQVETMFPLLYDRGVNTGRLSLPRLVAVMCENPARLFGLFPKKGTLDVGADADVVIVDPTVNWTIKAAEMHTVVDYCTYEDWRLLGKPVRTMQRGNDILIDGKIIAKPGQGQWMPGKAPQRPV